MKPIIALTLLLITLSTSACAEMTDYPSATLKYKIVVEVDTPEGVKTGSSIRTISAISRPKRLGESNDTFVNLPRNSAEAVAIDLGKSGVMFALIQGENDAMWIFFHAFPTPCPEGAVSRCSIKYYSGLSAGTSVTLSENLYPLFAVFKDLADPKSIVGISANLSKQGFKTVEEVFGKNIKIRSVKIEITDEPYLPKVEAILPWLPTRLKQGGTLGGNPEQPFVDPTNTWITAGHFKN